MNEASSPVASEHSFFDDELNKLDAEQNKTQFDFSKNSSNPEGIFDTLNKEIKHVVENCKDLSYYSNSNSKISEQQQNNEQFLDSRYWCVRKNNNEIDSSFYKYERNDKKNNNNKINSNKNEKDFEEKILYINDEDEKNNFNDDFDIEDMEEKTIENKENGINEINSIKVNNNNLNNKNKDNLYNNNINNFNNNNNNFTKLKNAIEQDEQFLYLNEKLNPKNTPNKISQSYFPCIYNNQQVHSFVSTYNNYPSTFSKGSFISTNNSSNNKYKKDEDHCSSEIEEEIRINNNINCITNEETKKISNSNNHGNKFGPHLNNYNQLANNNISNINYETANLTNINNINNLTNFNINNNFLYNRIPKMNLNMVYYIPVQQQPISNNANYMNNNKIFSNLNNIISDNNSNSINIINKAKESNNTKQNNSFINNNTENKTNNNSSSEEKKQIKLNNSTNNNNNNHKNNNSNSNNINNNYKNNNYRKNENNNNISTNMNSSTNNSSTNNIQCNKGEKNLLNLDDIASGKDTRTTVMIRNIPIKYTDETLIEALEEFKGKFNCLYMPFDYEKNGNKGYAFINFVNPLHILYFHEKFYGKKWQLFESSKICELNSANFQGINEIQKHSKNYKGLKKPVFYSEQSNKINNCANNENMIIPSKYLGKLKIRFPNMKYHENKNNKVIIVDSFE